MSKTLLHHHDIQNKIYSIRGMKVMLDQDLAELYQIETKSLKRQVNRNKDRFPSDFMFQLMKEEHDSLRYHFGTLKKGEHSKYLPYAFTEQGVAMLSSVLNSKIAVQINIQIMRTFIEIRQAVSAQPGYELLREKILRIESKIETIDSKIATATAHQTVDGAILERKISSMSAELLRVSQALDNFQDAHLIIKRPEDGTPTQEQ